jgi:hypothetical protein
LEIADCKHGACAAGHPKKSCFPQICDEPGLVREYSDTLLIFLLNGLRPAKYRERYDVVVEAGDSLVQAIA